LTGARKFLQAAVAEAPRTTLQRAQSYGATLDYSEAHLDVDTENR
jgi:hypothetical protein